MNTVSEALARFDDRPSRIKADKFMGDLETCFIYAVNPR